MKKNKCLNCKSRYVHSPHLNNKWFVICKIGFRKNPKSNMTKSQIMEAKKMIGKISRDDIAEELGVSLSSLKRAFIGTRLAYYNKYEINQKLVKEVCRYYGKHGKSETQKRYPDVNVRSIVERYKYFNPRCIKWTDKQILEAARMGGLVSFRAQAKFFNRPRAHAGSVKSLWQKRFGFGGGNINGMSAWMAREIVKKDCPLVISNYWKTKSANGDYSRKIYLWIDMQNHIKKGTPKFIKQSIIEMAKFQKWLYEGRDVRREITKIMKRELI